MSLSAALGAAAPPHQLDHAGKTYEARPLTQAGKVQWSKALLKKSLEAARVAHEDDAAGCAVAVARLCHEYGVGEFAFESERSRDALARPAGTILLGSILFGVDESEFVRLLAARGPEVIGLVKLVLSESLPGVTFEEKGPADPNAPAPAST